LSNPKIALHCQVPSWSRHHLSPLSLDGIDPQILDGRGFWCM
jgi:hypothetical protein